MNEVQPIEYRVVIGGVDYTQYVAIDNTTKIELDEKLNAGNTANVTLRSDKPGQGFNIQTGDVAEIWFDNTLESKGTIGDFTPRIIKVVNTTVREYVLPLDDHNIICAHRLYTNAFAETTSGAIVKDIIDSTLFADGITYTNQSISDGRLIIEAAYNTQRVNDILDDLARTNGFYWYIDVDKVLWFRAMDLTNEAPFVITDDASNTADNFRLMMNTLKISSPRTQYRNRLYVRGYGITDEMTDIFTADGVNTQFVCGFEIQDLLYLFVNGVPQSFEVDSRTAVSEFMWKFGEAQVRASKEKVLNDGDIITIIYRGRFPLVVSAEDSGEIAARAAIEGNSGVYESIEEKQDMYGFNQLQNYVNAKLIAASRIPTVISYKTQQYGIHPAMVQQVTSTGDALNFSLDAVIDTVKIRLDVFGKPIITVSATAGTTLDRWWDWFKSVKLAAESSLISTGSVTMGVKTQDIVILVDGISVMEIDGENLWDVGRWDYGKWV